MEEVCMCQRVLLEIELSGLIQSVWLYNNRIDRNAAKPAWGRARPPKPGQTKIKRFKQEKKRLIATFHFSTFPG